MDDRTGAEKNPEKTARKVAKDLAPADPAAIMDPRTWAIHVTATGEISCGPMRSPTKSDCSQDHGAWIPASVPPRSWSGEADFVHPTSQSNRLAECLEGARVETVPDAANFGLTSIYT